MSSREKMKLVILFTTIWILCGVYGNMVSLTPSPEAHAKEGETLDLHCNYTGTFTSDYVSWYLNGDTFGLVIDSKDCKYQTKPNGYELNRLNTSCNISRCTLSIVSISTAKDNGARWECEHIIISNEKSPGKSSTTIKVIDPGTPDDRVGVDKSNIWIVATTTTTTIIGVIVIIVVGVIVLKFVTKRNRRTLNKNGKSDDGLLQKKLATATIDEIQPSLEPILSRNNLNTGKTVMYSD